MKLILTAEVENLGVVRRHRRGQRRLRSQPPAAPRSGHRRPARGAQKQVEGHPAFARDSPRRCADLDHANELKTGIEENLDSVSLPVKTSWRFGQAVRLGDDRCGRDGDPQSRRTQPRQARGAFAQGAHQGRWQPSDHFARAPRRGRQRLAGHRHGGLSLPADNPRW